MANSIRDVMKDAIRKCLMEGLDPHEILYENVLKSTDTVIAEMVYDLTDEVFDVLGINPKIQDLEAKERMKFLTRTQNEKV